MTRLYSKAYLQQLFGDTYIPEHYGLRCVIYLGEELYLLNHYSDDNVQEALRQLHLMHEMTKQEMLEQLDEETTRFVN